MKINPEVMGEQTRQEAPQVPLLATKAEALDAFASLVAAKVLEGLSGVPRGFLDKGTYVWIRWQDGARKDGANGAQVEDVLDAAMRRLTDFQRGALACEEHRVALRLLALARDALASRTRHRAAQGVEATTEPHETPEAWQAVARPLLEVLSRVSLSGLALPEKSAHFRAPGGRQR